MEPRRPVYPGYPNQGRFGDGWLYGQRFRGISLQSHTHMSEPEPANSERTPQRATPERPTLKSRPTLVLLLLIGSCYAIGYTIFRLLKGMQQ